VSRNFPGKTNGEPKRASEAETDESSLLSGVQVILGADDGTNPFQLNENIEKL